MFEHAFNYIEPGPEVLSGILRLDDVPNGSLSGNATTYRSGSLHLNTGAAIDLSFVHSTSTGALFYTSPGTLTADLVQVISPDGTPGDLPMDLELPGQLRMGAVRRRLIEEAVSVLFRSPQLISTLEQYSQDEIVILPVIREGITYGLQAGLLAATGYYSPEILLDVHHVYEPSIPSYERRSETGMFKYHDMSEAELNLPKMAIIGDSIASGTVVSDALKEALRIFPQLERVEVVSQFAALRGLARLCHLTGTRQHIRVHSFETPLNALPPSYFYSAHFPEEEFHIVPQAHRKYREWWGQDDDGLWIADTACAGYGWSEAYFVPRKHIRMMNSELRSRHGLEIHEIIAGHL